MQHIARGVGNFTNQAVDDRGISATRHTAIDALELGAIIGDIFKHDSFGVTQEKQIESLGEWLHFYSYIAIHRQRNIEILVYL